MLGENSSREGSSEEGDAHELSEHSSLADHQSAAADENNVKGPLMISSENSVGTIAVPAPSPYI